MKEKKNAQFKFKPGDKVRTEEGVGVVVRAYDSPSRPGEPMYGVILKGQTTGTAFYEEELIHLIR